MHYMYIFVYSAQYALFQEIQRCLIEFETISNTSPCVSLHSMLSYRSVLNFLELHCTDCSALHCALKCTKKQCTVLHCTAIHCNALTRTAIHCIPLHSSVLKNTSLYCTAPYCTTLPSTALHCIAL